MNLTFTLRTAFTVALLTVVYQETGWATTLLLSLLVLRVEIENLIIYGMMKKAREIMEGAK